MAVPVPNGTQVLLSDDFVTPVSPALWDFNHFAPVNNPSFLGQTQMRQSLPAVANGLLALQLDTFNPTGPGSFFGGEIISNQTFTVDASTGIAFEARARIDTPVAGFLGGIFGFNGNGPAGALHSELDTELLSNEVINGLDRVETNVYSREPLGTGHPLFAAAAAMAAFHTYRMEWYASQVDWFIDGQLVRQDAVHVPQDAMAFHLNIWAPGRDFADAFSASLVPALSPLANTTLQISVDFARVLQLDITPPRAVADRGDFYASGTSDILWRNAGSGATVVWQMNGATALDTGFIGGDANWRVAASGDFNGDAHADLLWVNSGGPVVMWQMNGRAVLNSTPIGGGGGWSVAATGDFNGDHKVDILWHHVSGPTVMWLMNGAQVTSAALIGADPAWQVVGTPDLNGDGNADILQRNLHTGQVLAWEMNGSQVIASGLIGGDANFSIVGAADFNNDGNQDLLWRDAVSGTVIMWEMSGLHQILSAAIGGDGDWSVVGAGRFFGAGPAGIIWQHTSGLDVLWQMNGTQHTSSAVIGGDPAWKANA